MYVTTVSAYTMHIIVPVFVHVNRLSQFISDPVIKIIFAWLHFYAKDQEYFPFILYKTNTLSWHVTRRRHVYQVHQVEKPPLDIWYIYMTAVSTYGSIDELKQ